MADTNFDQVLRIEYAGIIALKIDSRNPPEALIVDVPATMANFEGRQVPRARHYPSVMIEAGDHITTPEPTFVTATPTRPGQAEIEQHLWTLDSGSTISIKKVSDSGQIQANDFTFNAAPVSVAQLQSVPTNAAGMTSLAWMIDLCKLGGVKRMAANAPIFATVPLNFGDVRALVPAASMANWLTYKRDGVVLDAPKRIVAALFVQEITYQHSVTLQLRSGGADQTILFNRREDGLRQTNVVISNLCSCPTTGPLDHFNAFLHLLDGEKTVCIFAETTGLFNPLTDPENCYNGLIDLRD